MFKKLIKYEIKAAGKWYFLLYGSAMFVATILGFVIKSASQEASATGLVTMNDTLTFLLSMTFIALISGTFISTLFLIIARFNKNVYGREGYLTLTLPVSTHAIIWSKVLTSAFWTFLNSIVLALCLALLSLPSYGLANLLTLLPRIRPYLLTPQAGLFLSFVIISTFVSILSIYVAISIGQLFQDRRGLMGFVSYFAISVIWSVINFTFLDNQMFVENPFDSIPYLIFLNIDHIIAGVIFYFGTCYIMKNRLNIQ